MNYSRRWINIRQSQFLGNIALTLLYPVIYVMDRLFNLVATLLALVPPIGGFVVVAQMLRECGTCIQISAGDQ